MARPISSEGRYAREVFPHLHPRFACRLIRRAGGAQKLSKLSQEARALLLGVSSDALAKPEKEDVSART